ncbi:MAG: AmmeMemoRadiSam system protein B, partial [Nanoarchaeota archaeon]|nr:AmmeMemoRadiSam system protein B [Nanoarchaeota archaeon]
SHSGFSSGISIDDWETPIGIVKTDRNFGRKLSEISNLPIDEDIHKQEHSIEVQLPFLQFASRDKLKELRILPIMISPDINYKEIALHIKKTIEAEKKRVVLIASSDFTHFGHNYGYVPFKDNIRESLYKLDKDAIELIKGLKTADFLKYTDKTQATICGKYPIAAMLETSKLLNAKKGFLLQYYTSGDIVNDYTNAVGYASVVVK